MRTKKEYCGRWKVTVVQFGLRSGRSDENDRQNGGAGPCRLPTSDVYHAIDLGEWELAQMEGIQELTVYPDHRRIDRLRASNWDR